MFELWDALSNTILDCGADKDELEKKCEKLGGIKRCYVVLPKIEVVEKPPRFMSKNKPGELAFF